MNLERVNAALDWAEAHPDQFDMRSWGYTTDATCGTVCCLAGAAAMSSDNGWVLRDHELSVGTWAREYFDMDYSQSEIFYMTSLNLAGVRKMIDFLSTDPDEGDMENYYGELLSHDENLSEAELSIKNEEG